MPGSNEWLNGTLRLSLARDNGIVTWIEEHIAMFISQVQLRELDYSEEDQQNHLWLGRDWDQNHPLLCFYTSISNGCWPAPNDVLPLLQH